MKRDSKTPQIDGRYMTRRRGVEYIPGGHPDDDTTLGLRGAWIADIDPENSARVTLIVMLPNSSTPMAVRESVYDPHKQAAGSWHWPKLHNERRARPPHRRRRDNQQRDSRRRHGGR